MTSYWSHREALLSARFALRRCLLERACGIEREDYLSYWLGELGGLMGAW